jgi:dsRNA-specific ribonuclease
VQQQLKAFAYSTVLLLKNPNIYLAVVKKCRLEEEKGPAHRGIFLCSVHVETEDGNFNELGEYRSRLKDAEKSAALNMFTKLAKE